MSNKKILELPEMIIQKQIDPSIYKFDVIIAKRAIESLINKKEG